MTRSTCPLLHVRFAATLLLVVSAALNLAACGDDKAGTSEGSTVTAGTTSTGSSSTTGETTAATGTTDASPCAALDCAGCAMCMKEGECADRYVECAMDPECVGFADCVIPDCILLGSNGEACVEACFAKGDMLKAEPYVSCVEAVCDPVCFE